MRVFRKLFKNTLTISFLILSAVIGYAALSSADGTGQIEGGNIYQIRNVTQNTGYSNPANANACDLLKYDVRLHNSGFDSLSNLVASATLPAGISTSNTSDMTVTYSGGVVASTSATANVNLTSAQSLTYVSGTTQLFDGNNNLIRSLPDGIIGPGVNLGSINGSTTEFVNFEVKVSCPTPPPPVFSCDSLDATVGDNRTVTVSTFNVTAKNGATFKNADINWGDSHTDTGLNPVVGKTHQYAQDGTYTIVATAHFDVNGQDKTAGGPNCMKTVTITTTPPPVFTCDQLRVTQGDNRTVTVSTFNVTAKNGATFKNADINWGDSHTDTGLNPVVGKTHQYTQDGTFTIAATAHFMVNGQDQTAGGPNCMQTITVTTPPSPIFTCDLLDVTAGSNRTVTITNLATTAKNGATFKNADLNWGDGHTDSGLNPVVGKTHQYSHDGTFVVAATAHFTVNGQDKTADGANCMKTVQFTTPGGPVFTCDNLTVTASNDRMVTVTAFNTTANKGATFKNAVISWGDNSTPLTSPSPVGQTHQFGSDGTFVIVATAHFEVNGTDETASGPSCMQVVTFQTNQPPTVTPPSSTTIVTPSGIIQSVTPAASATQLVNTGPGSLIGLFTLTSVIGSLAYRYYLRQRLEAK